MGSRVYMHDRSIHSATFSKSNLWLASYIFVVVCPLPISLKISVMVSVMASPPAFSISALAPSAPGSFPNLLLSIADFTSAADRGSMLTSFVPFRDVCYA